MGSRCPRWVTTEWRGWWWRDQPSPAPCSLRSNGVGDEGVADDCFDAKVDEAATTKVAKMVRGSVVVHRRRCGKANCRCAQGTELHESVVLSYSDVGKTRLVMLPAGVLGPVRAATARYRSAKARIEDEANAGLEALLAELNPRRSEAR